MGSIATKPSNQFESHTMPFRNRKTSDMTASSVRKTALPSGELSTCDLYLIQTAFNSNHTPIRSGRSRSSSTSTSSGHWTLLLLHPDKTTYSVFYSTSTSTSTTTPTPNNPNTTTSTNTSEPTSPTYTNHTHTRRNHSELRTLLSNPHNYARIGVIQEEDVDSFAAIFDATQPGPDQFFAGRFLTALADRGLVERYMAEKVFVLARYSEADREGHRGGLAAVDAEFVGRRRMEMEEGVSTLESMLGGGGWWRWIEDVME
ncbi:hypothetical protein BJX61DRAFT_546067 [Aspergillus egyptiacus]|nr:hypothetical protein BJX61DRAFT_546067 [Aspergillus egyptiacus]